MGIVLRFHAHSARFACAANSASSSSVTPPALAARGNATIADHQESGIRSRCHHLETELAEWPICAASSSRVGHNSIIDRNEANSDMPNVIGRGVLNVKPQTAYDMGFVLGHNVLIGYNETRRAIVQRTREAWLRTGLTQAVTAKKLGIEQGIFKNYVKTRPIPHELVPLFCEICGITPNDLFPAANQEK